MDALTLSCVDKDDVHRNAQRTMLTSADPS